jgi:uncharacterized protein
MKTATDIPAEAAAVSPGSVAAYLREHPAFFEEHPEVLALLSVPHGTGPATSLLERQAQQLRAENRELRRRLQALVGIARDNETLSRKLHALTRRLVQERAPDALLQTLGTALREDFGADHTLVRVFARPVLTERPVPEFVGPDAPEREVLTSLLADGKPFCGRLTRACRQLLFDAGQAETGSAVVMPLKGRQWDGLLVVASNDPSRFSPDMGLELLSHMADITSLVIAPWVEPVDA